MLNDNMYVVLKSDSSHHVKAVALCHTRTAAESYPDDNDKTCYYTDVREIVLNENRTYNLTEETSTECKMAIIEYISKLGWTYVPIVF